MESSPNSSKANINTFFAKCRCCLEYGYMKSMWSEYDRDGTKEIYGEMLLDTFSITWPSLDDSQDYICESCVIRLRDASDFKKEVLASDQLMQEEMDEMDTEETQFKVEMLEDFDENDENIQEDELEEEKANASDAEYYEVEYLEEEMDEETKASISEKLDDAIPKETKYPQKKKKQEITRVYKKYSEDDMRQCLEAVRQKTMTISEASKYYGVPVKTVCTRLNSELNKKKPDAPRVVHTIRRTERHQVPAVKKHRDNLHAVLEYSNATPFKTQTGMFFTCNFCQKPYTQPKALKEHTLELHEDVSKAANIKVAFGFSIKLDVTGLKCKLCGEDMDLLEDLMTHLAYEHDVVIHMDIPNQMVPYKFDTKEIKCAVCSHNFNFFKVLAEHMSEHYRNFECEICGTPFINKQRYKMHKERHKTGVYSCSFCPKSFDNRMRRRDHERVVHINENKTQKCSYCIEKFVNIVQKLEHERSAHGGTYRVFKCNNCEQDFDNHKDLTRHTNKLHSVLKPYRCPECHLTFFKKQSLLKHMEKHPVPGQYLCMLCSEQFPDEQSIAEHMTCHDEDKSLIGFTSEDMP